MKKLTLLFLFISTLAFSQTNYVQVGNTLQQKDTVINGQTVKTYKVLKGSTGVWYPVTREWVLANMPSSISDITGLQDSLSNKYSKSDINTILGSYLPSTANLNDITANGALSNTPITIYSVDDNVQLSLRSNTPVTSTRLIGANGDFGQISFSESTGRLVLENHSPDGGIDFRTDENTVSALTLSSTGDAVFNGKVAIMNGTNNNQAITKLYADSITSTRQAILSGSGIVKSSSGAISYLTDNSANWNSAYSYSQVGHLPLSGGTLSGALSGTSAMFNGTVVSGSGATQSYLNSGNLDFYNAATSDRFIRVADDGSTINAIGFSKSGSTSKVWFPTGNVLINTSVDNGEKLQVNGSSRFTSFPLITAASPGRVPYFTTAGQMTDDADLTFDGTNLTSGGDVVVKHDLKIWGYNAAQAGFISSVDAGGGLALQASGTNKGIRLTTTGSGKVELFGSLNLNTSPSTSAGSYEFLTRNTSTGDVEKVGSTSLSAGTYTPTIGTSDNASSITPGLFHYKRIGNEVSVTGYVTFTTDMSGSGYVLVSLPVASSLTNANQIAGTATSVDEINIDSGFVNGDETADAAKINFQAMGGDLSGTLYVSFMYSVL